MYFANNVKVGDRVGVARFNRSYGGYVDARFGTVTKINGHGHIFVNTDNGTEVRFNKRGDEYKNETFGKSLVEAARLERDLADEEARKRKFKIANEIEELIKGARSYRNIHINDEFIAELRRLTDELEEFVK